MELDLNSSILVLGFTAGSADVGTMEAGTGSGLAIALLPNEGADDIDVLTTGVVDTGSVFVTVTDLFVGSATVAGGLTVTDEDLADNTVVVGVVIAEAVVVTPVGLLTLKSFTSFTENEAFSEDADMEGGSFSVRDLTWAETCSGVKYSAPAPPLLLLSLPLAPPISEAATEVDTPAPVGGAFSSFLTREPLEKEPDLDLDRGGTRE